MRLPVADIGGKIVKDTEVYQLKDNNHLKNLVVSSTLLHPKQQTKGHKHKGQEEVYFFQYGYGEMTLGYDRFPVSGGQVVLIPDGVFHKVHNTEDDPLYFVCVFDGKRYNETSS